jgi:hypothetical protein
LGSSRKETTKVSVPSSLILFAVGVSCSELDGPTQTVEAFFPIAGWDF